MLTWPDRFARARARTVTVTTPRRWWQVWKPKLPVGTTRRAPGFVPDDFRAGISWNTCAFGEQYVMMDTPDAIEVKPKKDDLSGEYGLRPVDPHLKEMGVSFYRALHNHDIDTAEFCYYAISRRMAKLTGHSVPAEVDRFLASLRPPEIKTVTPAE